VIEQGIRPRLRTDFALSVITGCGVCLGVLVAECIRTRAWTLHTPHSREALLWISLLGAVASASLACLAATAALLVSRARGVVSRIGLRKAFLLALLIGPLAALLTYLGEWASAGVPVLLLLGPAAVCWAWPSRHPSQASPPIDHRAEAGQAP
jgi:4-hydroxybenzoate polyprenyltransferase